VRVQSPASTSNRRHSESGDQRPICGGKPVPMRKSGRPSSRFDCNSLVEHRGPLIAANSAQVVNSDQAYGENFHCAFEHDLLY